MKAILLSAIILFSANFAHAMTGQEARIKSYLKAESVEIVSIDRDYSELLTGILYMYQWFDGHHDYSVKLKIDGVYEFECVTYYHLKSKVYQIAYCMEKNDRIDFKELLIEEGARIKF